jgi:TRAP-type uncharacterized transport system fused permease subunit
LRWLPIGGQHRRGQPQQGRLDGVPLGDRHFILPFMFVLDTRCCWTARSHVLQVLAMSVVGVLCISVANVDTLRQTCDVAALLLFGAGVLMIDTTIVTDAIGLTVTAFVVFLNIVGPRAIAWSQIHDFSEEQKCSQLFQRFFFRAFARES